MRELSRFDHPNIVRYFFEHIDVDSGKFYIGMEYMTGGSLAGKIKKTPLPEDNLRNYTHQILCGIKFLHEKHIAHRDIKPDNVLLSLDDPIIKLADFGISRKLEASLLTHGATTAVRGTVQYMSPEVVKGEDDEKKGYGLKTDIWSVGCVVLEMAKGTRPWSECGNATHVMFRIGNGEAPPVAENVPGDVKDFLMKTFIVFPKDRSSAEDLLKDKLLAGITSDDSGKAGTSSADRGYAVVGGGSRYLHPVSSFGGLETADDLETAGTSWDYMQRPKRRRSSSDTSDVVTKKRKVPESP
ncbi:uncharacterized protein LOC135498935 [Lineus longissimus]|uniref:uncharacterized protein LOC135498935 n=1 Tax=Lineus longissimus TaxID=88925 RepID=UPI00315D79F7